VTLAGATNLGIVGPKKRQQVSTWPVTGVQGMSRSHWIDRIIVFSPVPASADADLFDTASGKTDQPGGRIAD